MNSSLSRSRSRKQIGVYPSAEHWRRRRLFNALSLLVPVDFSTMTGRDERGVDARIIFSASAYTTVDVAVNDIPSLEIRDLGEIAQSIAPVQLSFTTADHLHDSLRNQYIMVTKPSGFVPLELDATYQPLAFLDRGVYWALRNGGNSFSELVAVSPPEIPEGHLLYELIQSDSFARLVPLLHFLYRITQEAAWISPPLRASLMFDDPNLHSLSYGFLSYEKLLIHSKQCRYHTSIATIPFDGWKSKPEVARLFRDNAERVSLIIHGNNHTHCEFGGSTSSEDKRELIAQALKRIGNLEKRSGVRIAKIFSAPHSALDDAALDLMRRFGCDAACVDLDKYLEFNRSSIQSPIYGLNITEIALAGFPLIPRLRMDTSLKTRIIAAAFFNQPLIPYFHHWDLRSSYDILADVAETINNIGNVTWMTLDDISKSNYLSRTEDHSLHVKLYSPRIIIEIPDHITELSVEVAWGQKAAGSDVVYFKNKHGIESMVPMSHIPVVIPIESPDTYEVFVRPFDMLDPNCVPNPFCNPWSAIRRVITELRDRSLPLLNRKRAAVLLSIILNWWADL